MPWIVLISLLVLAGCQPHVNVRGDTPEPYMLSKCTRDFMEELNRQGKLPRCMIVDAERVNERDAEAAGKAEVGR